MKKIFLILTTLFLIQSCKKTEACMEVSNENPGVDEYIEISGDCSVKAKWYVFEVDGNIVSSDMDPSTVISFSTKGNHLVKLTVYRSWSGSYNSNTGCSRCKGEGASSSTSKTIRVE